MLVSSARATTADVVRRIDIRVKFVLTRCDFVPCLVVVVVACEIDIEVIIVFASLSASRARSAIARRRGDVVTDRPIMKPTDRP